MSQKNILHFIPSLRSGGMERQFVELMKGFKSKGEFSHELVLLSPEIHYKLINDLELPITIIERNSHKDISIFWKFSKYCSKSNPNIIHSWESMCSVYALPTAKLQGRKFVNGFIRDVPPTLSYINKNKIRALLTFPFSDAIISNTKAGLKAYKITKKQAQFIYNGFDLDRIKNLQDPKTLKASLDILPSHKIIGMVASFYGNKDHTTFIKSCQIIMTKRSDVTVILVGDGPNIKDCKRLISPKFTHRFLFLGKLMDVENIINLFNIGVLTTNIKMHGEGISNSIMEYMALSKPAVVTNCEGNIELVSDGNTGFIVDHGSVTDLTNKILFLIDHPALAESYGSAGYQCIKNNFPLTKMVDAYSLLYRKLTEA